MKKTSIQEELKQLETIAMWFDKTEEVDVEEGLTMVREGATLIKSLKANLAGIKNEFEEIKKGLID